MDESITDVAATTGSAIDTTNPGSPIPQNMITEKYLKTELL